jgi:hypothetical protein
MNAQTLRILEIYIVEKAEIGVSRLKNKLNGQQKIIKQNTFMKTIDESFVIGEL